MDQRNPARAAPQNRSFIVGEFAKSLDVVYIDAFASCGQHAALLPPGEQAAYGKQSRAGHLRQLLARKVDLKRATPVDATPQLVKQAQQLMTQPCRHLFRGNLAVTLLEFFEALCSHFYDIALIWESSAFHALAERFPALQSNIIKVAAQRLEELEERYREISTEKVATRLSHQLLRLFNQLGRRVNGSGTLEINLSREELAQMTGTTLFTVSRLLSGWKERGVLTARRECVYVHNIQALREFADNE